MARATLNADGDKVIVETLFREKDLVKQIPGASWNAKESAWHAPLSWGTCVILRGIFGANLEVEDDLAEWARHEVEARVNPAVALREAIDAVGSPRLFGYQRAGVQFLKVAKRALLCDGLGAGKAQPLSEPVLTPDGFVPMGKIQQGDYVIGSDGRPTLVYGVYRQGVRPVYKVSFSDGTYAYADQDHLWRVQSLKNFTAGHWQVLSTAELLKRGVDQIVQSRGSRHHKWRVPFVAPVEFTQQSAPLPLDPYVLGVLLGDGSLSSPSRVGFCSVDQEIVDRVSERLPDGVVAIASKTDSRSPDLIGVRLTRGHGSNANPVLNALRELKLHGHRAETKFVPERYLHASVKARLELLRGLMDTDGSAGKNNGAGFSSASEQLRDDVAFLVRSLGGLARCNVKEKTGGNFPAYGVYIRMPNDLVPFHLSRKAVRIHTPIKYTPSKFISAIEYSHEEETQCVAVTASDHCYVTRDFIVTHNTRQALMTAMAHYEAHLNDPDNYPSPFPILAVVPNSTKTGWKREAATVWPGLEVQVVKGSATVRRKQFETPAHMYVINWEAVRGHSRLKGYGNIALRRCKECGGEDERVTYARCEVHPRELNQLDFGMVIGDEVHRMKDPSAKQTRAMWAATGDAPYRYGLTGTPIADAPDDLWSILHWLDPTEWPSRVKFIDRFASLQYNAFGAPIITGLKPETKDEFFRIVNPRMRRMPKELVLSHLPPVMRERRDVEMTPKQKKSYEDMRDRMVTDLDGDILTAASPLTKMTRLIQFSSSYAEVEETIDQETGKPNIKVRLTEPSCKLDAFMADLPDFGDDSVVVFAQSRQLIYLLHERLEKAGIAHGLITGMQNEDERQQAIDDFQSGRTQFVLATLGAGGTGLNLFKGRIAVYLQRSWSLIENEQSEGRVHRIGSEIHDSVLYIDYVTTDSVEEVQHQAVAAKGERLEEILRDRDLLKRALLDNSVMEWLSKDVHDAQHNDGATEDPK